MGVEIVAPIVVFGSLVLIIWSLQHFSFKKRAEAFQTLRLAIEKGQPLTPEALESMARISSPIADLRRGVVFLAIALGFALFATILGANRHVDQEEWLEAMRALYAVSSFPLVIGLAFLGLHFFANESKRR
jgi:hypothetical protein